MAELTGQVAVVTGGGSGIGLAIAAALLAQGMRVVIAGRTERKLDEALASLGPCGGTASALIADVSDDAQVQRLVNGTLEALGHIDLLVNNAGIGMLSELRSVADSTEAEWDRMLDINLKGAFLCSRAVLPAMRKQNSGYVMNIASRAGVVPIRGAAAYSAAKAGMIAMAHNIVLENAKYNIRATAICPGFVATPMVEGVSVPRTEMIPPEDIGGVVVALLRLSAATVVREVVMERTTGFVG